MWLLREARKADSSSVTASSVPGRTLFSKQEKGRSPIAGQVSFKPAVARDPEEACPGLGDPFYGPVADERAGPVAHLELHGGRLVRAGGVAQRGDQEEIGVGQCQDPAERFVDEVEADQ